MNSIKSDARGISPIVATILLIATTAVAAGVIAAYVSGLYVSTPTIIAGSADGSVYDQDEGAGENYINGRLSMVVTVAQGRLRDITDTTYGFTASLQNTRSGWNTSFSLENVSSQPASGSSGTVVFTGTANWTYENEESASGSVIWTVDNNYPTAALTARLTVDSQHRWTAGSSMIIEIDNYLWLTTYGSLVNVAWKDGDTISVTISGRDSLSLTGYGGAYLGGTRIG